MEPVVPEYSETGLQPLAASAETGAAAAILGGLSQDSLPGAPATQRTQKRDRQWRVVVPQSAKRRLTVPEISSMAERPRPTFDRAWAVKGDDENDTAERFHDGSRRNQGTTSKEGTNPLDDWDAMLRGSSLSRCDNSENLMNVVKAFFHIRLPYTARHRQPQQRADQEASAGRYTSRPKRTEDILPSQRQGRSGHLRSNCHCKAASIGRVAS